MTVRLVLAAHLACAFGAAAVFWVPLFAHKGGSLHLRAGRLYARLIYLTAITGVPLATLLFAANTEPRARETAAFLAYLLVILVMPVVHGIRVVRAARLAGHVGASWHTALAALAIVSGLVMGGLAIRWRIWPYLLLSPVGPLLGMRALWYARRQASAAPAPSWREEHMIAMVMSGVAVHTAMLVFGTSRTLGLQPAGALAYVPWLLPALVGVPALIWGIARERGRARA